MPARKRQQTRVSRACHNVGTATMGPSIRVAPVAVLPGAPLPLALCLSNAGGDGPTSTVSAIAGLLAPGASRLAARVGTMSRRGHFGRSMLSR